MVQLTLKDQHQLVIRARLREQAHGTAPVHAPSHALGLALFLSCSGPCPPPLQIQFFTQALTRQAVSKSGAKRVLGAWEAGTSLPACLPWGWGGVG